MAGPGFEKSDKLDLQPAGHNYLGNSMYCRYSGQGGREEGIVPISRLLPKCLVIGVMIENDVLKQEGSY